MELSAKEINFILSNALPRYIIFSTEIIEISKRCFIYKKSKNKHRPY